MPDHDEDLTGALQDYYRAMAQSPAPDNTERVMMSADRRSARIRRWGVVGGRVLAAAAVGAVVAVALVTHNASAPVAPGALLHAGRRPRRRPRRRPAHSCRVAAGPQDRPCRASSRPT